MIEESFKLPCGAVLKNRLGKAAMTERFSNSDFKPNQKHYTLYENWAKQGVGLLITGNVMMDQKNLESAGNVVAKKSSLPELKKWAAAATQNNTHCWVQLSHSGRQTSIFNNRRPVSASDVKLRRLGFFNQPRALTENEIEEIIQQFVDAAVLCKEAGFTGIQIHGAHGYLISQFLSPITNLRTDQWGGSLENRSRFIFEIVKKTRKVVGKKFPVSVKLNSSDFQKGGFSEEDSIWVISELEKLGVDLLEVSGGTYENAEFLLANNKKDSTIKREAFFLDFTQKVRTQTKIPLMITGGIRTLKFSEEILKKGFVDVAGLARPFLLYDNFGTRFLSGEILKESPSIKIGLKGLEDMSEAGFYNLILDRLGRGKKVKWDYSSVRSAFHLIKHEFVKSIQNKLN
ncbi:MAG: NADH:flavin oxidoreductase/NADH oxidase family protein [Reichenbachiella sp.]